MARRKSQQNVTLREAAELLGIHYMTAYRYVRLGKLRAEQADGRWWVRPSDIEALRRQPVGTAPGIRGRPDWKTHRQRLDRVLLAGDTAGAWVIVENVIRGGAEPAAIYVDLLAPSLRAIGTRWSHGELTVADEHRATAVARRLVGRLSPRFARTGRSRASVLLGGAAGDPHELPLAMLSDVLRGSGYDVIDLGPNTPVESFVETGQGLNLSAIGISAATDAAVNEAGATTVALRRVGVHLPILVGGPAVDESIASSIGADGWAADARAALPELARLLAVPTV